MDRKAAVDEAMEAVYPNLTKGTPRTVKGSGYAQGRAAGRRADLGSTRVTNHPNKPLR
jgi:hypothetical protein